jgi:hypothetical protein
MISLLLNRFTQRAMLLAAVVVCGGVQAQTAFELQELNTTLQVAAQKIQAYDSECSSFQSRSY